MQDHSQPTPAAAKPTSASIDPRRRYLCRHVFTNGHRCGSPSLRGKDLCYYHQITRRTFAASTGGADAPLSALSFAVPHIDDRAGIQLALHDVLSRLASCDLDTKRAGLLLYGLQIASSNLPRHQSADAAADAQPMVEEVTFDFCDGDLAPIAEILNPAETPLPTEIPLAAEVPAPAEIPPQPPCGLSPSTPHHPIDPIESIQEPPMPNQAASPNPNPNPNPKSGPKPALKFKSIPNPRGNQTRPQTNQPSPATPRTPSGRFTPAFLPHPPQIRPLTTMV